ncbi:hypothetical protein [Pendulispora rubella]
MAFLLYRAAISQPRPFGYRSFSAVFLLDRAHGELARFVLKVVGE